MTAEYSEQTRELLSAVGEYDEELLEEMYRLMQEIRVFEERASELSDTGEIPGPLHLYIGQEAVAVGAILALDDDDFLGSTHRGHGHVLARGADVSEMMAELAGKRTGLNNGRGGSMHMVDFSLGIFGCNAIVGASVPHVVGGALSANLDDTDRVGLSFFGDGAANEGVVHESMNMAAIWDLPVVFLCENNQYAVSTPAEYTVAGGSIADRADGYDMPGTVVDGQNVLEVYETVSEHFERIRNGDGPGVIECKTLRYSGHFSGEEKLAWLEDRPYRPDGETEDWRERKDPISTFRTALVESGQFSAAELDDVDDAVEEKLDDAVEFALVSEYPPAEKAPENTYAQQDYPNLPAPKYRE